MVVRINRATTLERVLQEIGGSRVQIGLVRFGFPSKFEE
jgi:hypothetical protein